VFVDAYRDSEIGDVLVMLLLFFFCKDLHDELCVWVVRMGKWDAIGWAGGGLGVLIYDDVD
jgi:hypothetical protein